MIMEVDKKADEKVEEIIVNEVNKVPNAILVMGAAGRNIENAQQTKGQRAHGQAPMGHVSEFCLVRCSRPVMLIRNGMDTTDEAMRRREKGGEPFSIMCAVSDTGELSTSAFDLAAHLAGPADKVAVVNVPDTDSSATPRGSAEGKNNAQRVKEFFTDLCGRKSAGDGACFGFEAVRKGTSSIRDTLIAKADTLDEEKGTVADVVIMGSFELAATRRSSSSQLPGVGAAPALGSVAAAVAKRSEAHVVITKPFA